MSILENPLAHLMLADLGHDGLQLLKVSPHHSSMPAYMPKALINVNFNHTTYTIERPSRFALLVMEGHEAFNIRRAHKLVPMLVSAGAGSQTEINAGNYETIQDGDMIQFRVEYGRVGPEVDDYITVTGLQDTQLGTAAPAA